MKLWLLLYCCLVVILRNAEVPNGLLKLKHKACQLFLWILCGKNSPKLLDTQKLIVSEHGVDIDV